MGKVSEDAEVFTLEITTCRFVILSPSYNNSCGTMKYSLAFPSDLAFDSIVVTVVFREKFLCKESKSNP